MDNIFEIYMQQKAKNFMIRNKYKLPDSVVTNAIECCKTMVFETAGTSTPINNSSNLKQSGNLRNNNYRNGYRKSYNGTSNTNQTANQQTNRSTQNNRSNEYTSYNRFRNYKKMATPENKTETKMSADLSPVPKLKVLLQLNIVQDVVVSYADDRNTYVILKESQKTVEELLEEINKAILMNKIATPIIGKIYAALFCGAWYRAMVIAIEPKLHVKFIDYGNNDFVSELRELPVILANAPAQAIKIRFQNPPAVELQANQKLKVKPIQMDPDGCFLVLDSDQSPNKSPPISTTTKVEGLSKPVQPAKKDKPIIIKKSPPKNHKITEVSSSVLNKSLLNFTKINNRKCAVDNPCSEAYLEFTYTVDSNLFVAFVFQRNLLHELNKFENIKGGDVDPFFNPKIGDTVAVFREDSDETNWVRGLVLSIKGNKYDLALIDYGIIVTSEKIYPLEKEFEDIVEFSCLCKVDSQYMQEIVEKKTIQCEILKDKHIIIKLDCGAVPVISFKWNPFETHFYSPPPIPELVITTLPKIKPLKEGEVVIIASEDRGCLYVQTKGGYQTLKNIEKELNVTTANILKSKPVVNQLILHKCEGKAHLCRGIVKTVDENNALVQYLDYGCSDLVPWRNISNITEKLAQIDCTLTKVKLQDFDGYSFSSEAIDELAKCSENKEKFTVILTSTAAVINLKDWNGDTLSNRLKLKENFSLTKEELINSNVILRKDLNELEMSCGKQRLLCMYTGELEKGLIAFCFTIDTEKFSKFNDEMDRYDAGSKKPYKPVLNEVCLALCDDSWCRAVVTDIVSNSKLEVYFVDYGIHVRVTINEIRSIPAEMTTLPLVSMLCEMKDLKDILATDSKVCEKVSNMLEEGSSYEINVIDRDKDIYNITIPHVIDALKAENLI